MSTPLHAVQSHRARLYAAEQAVGETGKITPLWPVGMTRDAGDFLRDLVLRERAGSTVEVGLGLGLSSLAIVEGLLASGRAGVAHVSIDPGQDWCDRAGVRTIAESGAAGIVQIIEKPSAIVLGQLWDQGRTFDLAFIDGAHWFDSVLVDLFLAMRVVKPGGLIVMDDHWMPSVQTVLAYAVTNFGFTLELFDAQGPGKRLVALRNTDAPHRRSWDHFAPFSAQDLPAYPWRKATASAATVGG